MTQFRPSSIALGLLTCAWLASLATAADAPASKPASDKDRLQGTWKLVSGEVNSQPLAPGLIERNFRVVVSDVHWDQFMGDDKTPDHWSYTLDPTKNPKQIDLTDLSPQATAEEKKVEGIYQLDGDTLRVCNRKPGVKGRPGEFRSADANTVVRVFQRVK